MLDYMYGRVALLLGAGWLVTAEAKAESSEERGSLAASSARTEVVLGTIGIHAQPVHGSLVALLRAELSRMKLALVLKEQTGESPSAWAIESTRSGRVLAAILLDGRSEQGWRLVVIDAARGRAIARALPGGIRDDAASVEAVVSIIVSAASALREGLEVASKPVAAVVDGPSAPTSSAVPGADTAQAPVPPPVPSPRKDWSFRGSVGASVASFSPAAPTTEGLALALGVRFRARFEARVFGSAFLPSLIRGPFGDFRVGRTFLGTAAGPVLGGPAFSFAPEAGIVAERLLRYDATPSAGVLVTPPGALYRLGGLLAARFRHTLLSPLSVELVTGMVYFGRRVDFTAKSPENSWSEGAWPAVAFAQLGLEIATN
jgi:hypothetical protein